RRGSRHAFLYCRCRLVDDGRQNACRDLLSVEHLAAGTVRATAKGDPGCSALALAFVVVEASAGLASQPPGIDQRALQGMRAIPGIEEELLVDALADRVVDVRTNGVDQLEGAHLEADPAQRVVDCLD